MIPLTARHFIIALTLEAWLTACQTRWREFGDEDTMSHPQYNPRYARRLAWHYWLHSNIKPIIGLGRPS